MNLCRDFNEKDFDIPVNSSNQNDYNFLYKKARETGWDGSYRFFDGRPIPITVELLKEILEDELKMNYCPIQFVDDNNT